MNVLDLWKSLLANGSSIIIDGTIHTLEYFNGASDLPEIAKKNGGRITITNIPVGIDTDLLVRISKSCGTAVTFDFYQCQKLQP